MVAERQETLAPLRVLIVEDSEDDALLLLRELARGGYEPEHERVETPEAMKEALAGYAWDVIFSDYRMPRFGAREALATWHEAGSEAPFIVVSGKVGEDVAVEMMKAGAHDYVMKDNLVRLCATVERALEEAEERRERKRAEKELRRREAILEAVGCAAERFLDSPGGWEESIGEILERIGHATGASRVYIFENYGGEDGEVWGTQRYEWVAKGVSAQMDNPLMEAIPYRTAGYGRWIELLSRGELVHGHIREFPEEEQPELKAQDILSILVVPIFVEGRWWGQIGLDECAQEREWSVAEIDALKVATSTLGAAVRRRMVEEELRGSEERYRAVIEQATDGIYLLDAGTRRVLETNPSYQNMLGYTAEELRGMEVYDFVAHPRENVDAVIQRTLEKRRRIVGERKYRRKDGTFVDVEVGVSVISFGGKEVICTIVRDVTERKRAEERLRASEAELRAVFGAMNDVILVLDGEGRYLKVAPTNPSLLYSPPAALLGKTVHDTFPKEQADEFLGSIRRALETRQRGNIEYSLQIGDQQRWFTTTISPMLEDSVVAVARDISERKRAEEELKKSEERFKGLAEATFEGVAITQDGRIVETNAAFAAMFGYESSEVVGMTPFEFVAPESRAAVRNARSSGLEEPYEVVSLRKDGTTFYTEIRGKMSYYKGHSVRVTAIRDITERKRAEEALRQSEQLYRTVIEQAAENICLVDAETKGILEANPAFRGALGYAEEELRSMTLYDIVAHDRSSVDANVRCTMQQKHHSIGQRKYRRKDGSLADVEVSASAILLDDKEAFCVVAHDITERVRVQKLLEERVATLSRIAANLSLELPAENTFDLLAESVVSACTAGACTVALIDEKTRTPHLAGLHGLPEGYAAGLQAAYRSGAQSPILEVFRTRKPAFIRDVHRRLLKDPLYAPLHRFADDVTLDAVYAVPLVSRGRAVGAMNFAYLAGQAPSEDEKAFLRAVADQTAIAVENSRLFAEARGKAALEERQRLARELHDSVSQALYGIALGAKTARTLLDRAPNQAADPLDYVLSLAEAGLAEMRALIFELRPESLEKEGLVAALEKQAAALRARHEIEVETTTCDEPEASPEAKETVYRIVQEALHNTVKHARANNVELKMECDSARIILEVLDDGVGFDARGDFPGHLGLRSMRERATRRGGTLEVKTAPGRGTRIYARIPV